MTAAGRRRARRLAPALTVALACFVCVSTAGAQTSRDFEVPTFVAPGVSFDQSVVTSKVKFLSAASFL